MDGGVKDEILSIFLEHSLKTIRRSGKQIPRTAWVRVSWYMPSSNTLNVAESNAFDLCIISSATHNGLLTQQVSNCINLDVVPRIFLDVKTSVGSKLTVSVDSICGEWDWSTFSIGHEISLGSNIVQGDKVLVGIRHNVPDATRLTHWDIKIVINNWL